MGLLDKSTELSVSFRKGGLLDKLASYSQSNASTALIKEPVKEYSIQKKKTYSFIDFIEASQKIINIAGGLKAGLLFSSGDYFIPYLLHGYDKTTLNKFRVKIENLSFPITKFNKDLLKNALSLREYLNEDSADFYFYFPFKDKKSPVLMLREQIDISILHGLSLENDIVSNELAFISRLSEQSVIFTSEEDIKPYILTAQLENMHIHTFSFSYIEFISHLGLPIDSMQESFLLHVINSVILNTFQRSALSLKIDDIFRLYFFSVSNQNPSLLKHQINRTLSNYFFGSSSSMTEIISYDKTTCT